MMNLSLSPPSNAAEKYSYRSWRERFLQVVLQGTSLLGLVAIILYFLTPAATATKLVAVLMYGLLLLVAWFTRVVYPLRVSVFLLLLYLAGFSSLIDYGLAEASVLFLGFIVMTGLLLPLRAGIYYAVGITLLTLLVFGRQSLAFTDWARALGIFLVVSSTMAIGLRTALHEFIKTQEAAQQMLDSLQTERSTLEQKIAERTAGLIEKTEQLRATSYIARKTAEIQDLASLLDTVSRLMTDQFGFYHTGILLLNEAGDRLTLQASPSEGGKQMIEQGYSLPVGAESIVGYVADQKKPHIALDVGEDALVFSSPYLPMTRSEIALPLIVRNKILGVLDIQSDKPRAFDGEDIDILQTLADQIAIAIENARLMDETQAAIMQLEALTSLRTRETWSQKLGEGRHSFTYTPLGLRKEKIPHDADKAVSAPIVLRGRKIGNISIARKGEANWSQFHRDVLEEVASQVGLAIDNIRLLEEATQRARREETVGKLATRFSQSLDLDTLLQTVARELGQLPDISEVSVLVGEETPQTTQARSPSKRKMS